MMRAVLVLVFVAQATAAFGQPWADAFRAGDYENAADLLHPIVAALDRPPMSDDPAPGQLLATMYARGLGVAADPIAACALAQAARVAARMGAHRHGENYAAYTAHVQQGEDFARDLCEPLPEDDRMTAMQSIGCYAFGMQDQVLTVGGHAVQVGRRGIALVGAGVDALKGLSTCPLMVARVRASALEPPDDAAPTVRARHFIEVFFWGQRRSTRDSPVTYVLHWLVHEVARDGVKLCTLQDLDAVDTWPPPGLAEIDARLSLQMIRSGHVRWKMEGAPPKRGWIMLPEENKR